MAKNKANAGTIPLGGAEALFNLAGESDGSEYYLKKNRYFRITCSKIKDGIGGFTINFKQPLAQFDTGFGRAFAVTRAGGNSDDFYAITLDKRYPVRLAEINKLAEHTLQHLVNIMAAQITTISVAKGRVFVVILEKPKGITLAEYIKKNGRLNPDYISRTLVPAISEVLGNLANFGVTHGKINANNVYIDDSGYVTIGECISEPCGFNQPIIYEPIERATAMPIGKGAGTSAVDYHALGVLVAIALRGADPTAGLNDDAILEKKFEDGTYGIVTEGVEISPQILDLLRGVLTERKDDVWDATQLKEWIKGRRFNLLPPADTDEAGRPIAFNDKKYMSRKQLAHGLYLNWDEAKKFVKQDTIIRWVDRNSQESELVERLEMAANHYVKDKENSAFDKDDEMLAHYILLLDPNGPFRLRDFSACLDGIGACLAEGFATNRRHFLEAVENIIARNLHSIISGIAGVVGPTMQDAMFSIQRCGEILRKKDFGFGIERCLYELNPTLPCQSPLVLDDISFTKEELLIVLDNNENIGGKILDVHMATFLSERMELLVKIHLSSLVRFPEFSVNMNIQVLALLSLAQQAGKMGELPKLSAKIYDGLKNVIEEFHSKTIRNELNENLTKVVKKGILSHLLRIIADPKSLVRDRLGFKKASGAYRANAIQILKLSNSRAVNNVGYRYGLQVAVMLSFFVATAELITLMIKAF